LETAACASRDSSSARASGVHGALRSSSGSWFEAMRVVVGEEARYLGPGALLGEPDAAEAVVLRERWRSAAQQ
jgi:hypothetical protein